MMAPVVSPELYAQQVQQKIGFIDSDLILGKMPEYQGIQQQLTLISQGWQDELSKMEQALTELRQDVEAREVLFTEEVRLARRQEIEQRETTIQQFLEQKYGPAGEYYTKQKELLQPLQRALFDALLAYAEQEGFDMIFDRSQNIGLMFARSEWDLTDEILEEMGLDKQDGADSN